MNVIVLHEAADVLGARSRDTRLTSKERRLLHNLCERVRGRIARVTGDSHISDEERDERITTRRGGAVYPAPYDGPGRL